MGMKSSICDARLQGMRGKWWRSKSKRGSGSANLSSIEVRHTEAKLRHSSSRPRESSARLLFRSPLTRSVLARLSAVHTLFDPRTHFPPTRQQMSQNGSSGLEGSMSESSLPLTRARTSLLACTSA